MGLLSAYTDDNKVIQSGLTITYSKSKVFGQWVAASMGSSSTVTYTEAWEYRRFAKGNFKFVGMDYESALSCANDMASKYVRDTKLSKWDPTGQSMFNAEFIVVDGGSVLMAEVAV